MNSTEHMGNRVGMNTTMGIFIFISCYFLVALVFYAVTFRRQRHDGGASSKYVKRLWIISSVNFCLTIAHAVTNLIMYNDAALSTQACNITRNLALAILLVLDATIYSFLWIRQYVVFENMNFRNKSERMVMNCLEWISLIIIIGVLVSSLVITLGFRRHIYDAEESCILTTLYEELCLSYLWIVGSISLHFILVLLFAYPLAKILRFPNASAANNIRKNSDNDLVGLVRRCLLISVACVVTDVIVMVLTAYTSLLSDKNQISPIVYNANVLFNSIILIFTFKNWRLMFFPWCRHRWIGAGIGGSVSASVDIYT